MLKIIKNKIFEALLKNKRAHLLNDEIVITCSDDRSLRVNVSDVTFDSVYFILIPSYYSGLKIQLSVDLYCKEIEYLLNGDRGSEYFIRHLIYKVNNATMLKLK